MRPDDPEPLRIGEVARRTGLTVRTLRHYDDLGLLVPSARSSGNYRVYSEGDLRRLLAIQHLKSIGLSLDDVARALDDPAFDPVDALRRHAAQVEERIAAERKLLLLLRRLDGAAEAGWEEVLAAISLTELLRHPDAGVRVRATLRSPAAAPLETLVEHLVGDPSPAVREVVTWALAQRGSAAVPALLARLSSRDADARRRVAHALSKIGDRSAVPFLVPLLGDADEAVAAQAAFALGRLGGAEARDALVARLGEPRGVLSDAVSDAVSQLGREAVGPLVRRLSDDRAAVREQAAEALALLGDPEAVPALTPLLADPDAGVRFAALLALGQIGGPEAASAVAGLTTPGDERTRLLAQRLAARLPGPRPSP